MKEQDRERAAGRGVDRRTFLKTSAAGIGAAAALGGVALPAAPPAAPPAAAGQKAEPLPGSVPQIAASEVRETLSADVAVVGLGISGMCAAVTAVEAGAKTVALEKADLYTARGFDDGCVNSSVHKDAGVSFDREEMIAELMRQANYRVDQRLIATWVDKSGEAVDWLRALLEPRGVKASVVKGGDEREGPYKVYHTAVNWTGQNPRLLAELEKVLKEKGGDIRYGTPAVQLLREGAGRVTGVIARRPDGGYLRVNARKGIILSTGGYENSPEMMRKYLRPSDLRIERFNSQAKTCTGDGHNMALAVGADMDEPPHCLIVGNGIVPSKDEFYLVMFTPWLRVDANGRRYVNEDSDYCRQANANAVLPKAFNWSVFDSRWGEGPGSDPKYTAFVKSQLDRYVKQGHALTADTLGELAKKMQVPAAVFEATVKRYNELADKKKDLDFGVAGDKMRPLKKAPFFALQVRNFCLVSVSGLRINENMQVLDRNGLVIPGLYASGNTSGGFFSDTYPRNVHGISHGRAITFGRLAAKHAAGAKA
ncbi:MAG TPA: FAD-dependent oxidoreductase [Candidatus Aminicenantes bacterium]|nr:FAD-dependent oxidoreductase [Candidatus Aminicenantes bacterium]